MASIAEQALFSLSLLCGCGVDGVDPTPTDTGIPGETGLDSSEPEDSGVDSDTDSDTDEPREDVDGDGQTAADGDCQDHDASVYRGASDVGGDGIDSNCDGIDSSWAVLVEAVASARLIGDAADDGLGNTAGLKVIVSPDATGDGLADVYVGGPSYFFDPEGPSRAPAITWLVSGLASGDVPLTDEAASTWTSGEEWTSDFAEMMDNAGDVDGDGLADAIIGAYTRKLETDQEGSAFVFSGGSHGEGGLADALVEIQGSGRQSFLGADVIGGTDLNGDGVVDLVVDAAGHDGLVVTEAFYGPRLGVVSEVDADIVLDGRAYSFVGGGSDFNEDGNDDLLLWVGDEIRLVSSPFAGSDPRAGFATFFPDGGNWSFSVGDVNGDGALDLAFGSASYDSAGANSGRVAFFLGPLAGTREFSDADAFLDAERADVGLSRGLSIAGDLDGDGDDEIVVGAPGVYADRVGAVAIFRDLWAGTLTTAAADLVIDGPELSDCFGWSLDTEGDLDGDGLDDVVVGAPYSDGWAGSVSFIPASAVVPLLP